MNATLACVLVLAAGTYAFRLAGPVLHGRVELPARVQELLAVGATVLLVALLATGALTQGQEFAGWARPAGVVVGGVLAWRRAPFAVVVVGAAAATGLLRLAGVV
ncbi:AzlD domain-containing protein [Streptomyces sp. NPDC006627]|uniref:AzlD domain-containing protein n=1 Tax=Streptomyces sp. NPDC006627 TaxID=3154679 RepID=UPI0033ADDA0D